MDDFEFKPFIVFGSIVVQKDTSNKPIPGVNASDKWSNCPETIPTKSTPAKSWAQRAAEKRSPPPASIPPKPPTPYLPTTSTPQNVIIPRGLINHGNMCFMNVILQPLLFCTPFYHYFLIQYRPPLKPTPAPLIDAM